MDQILRRAAVLTGGCVAGIALALSISSAAQADDQPPGLVNGLLGTVTEVVGNVLPPPPEREPEPEREPKPERPEPPKPERPEPPAKPKKPAQPVRDVIGAVVDVVDEVVNGAVVKPIVDTTTGTPTTGQPADPPPATVVHDEEPTAVQTAEEDPGPEPTSTATPTVPGLPRAPTPLADTAHHPTVGGASIAAHCGFSHTTRTQTAAEPDQGAADKPRDRIRAEKRRTPLYSSPRPPPVSPDRDATPSVGTAPCSTGGSQVEATLTARATQPRTHAAPVRDRYQSGHGTTSRPDAPSG